MKGTTVGTSTVGRSIRRSCASIWSLLFHKRLIHRQPEVDQALTAYLDEAMQLQENSFSIEEFLKLHHLRKSLKSLLDKPAAQDGLPGELIEFLETNAAPAKQEDVELFRAILDESRATVATWGGRMYFVYLPTWARYRIPDLASQDRDTVLRIVKELGIPVIDIHEAFAQHPDPLSLFPSRRHAHYNIEGHHLVAQEVLKRLAAVALDDSHVATNKPR